MIQRLDLSNQENVNQLLTLQQRSYMVEAKWIGSTEIPPLKDTVDSIQACGETFYAYIIDNQLAGMISYKQEEETLDIHRLAIDPDYFRKGVASALLHFVCSIPGIKRWLVSTGKANLPAIRCYEKHGFQVISTTMTSVGIEIVYLEKVNHLTNEKIDC